MATWDAGRGDLRSPYGRPAPPATADPAASVATNGDEVLVVDRAHVIKREFNQRLRATRSSHKLDFESFRFIHLNHCAQIATTKAVFGQVALQNNCV